MNSNIRNLEKDLRAFSKRNKNIRYTKGLLMTFLITGTLSLSTWGAISPSDYKNFNYTTSKVYNMSINPNYNWRQNNLIQLKNNEVLDVKNLKVISLSNGQKIETNEKNVKNLLISEKNENNTKPINYTETNKNNINENFIGKPSKFSEEKIEISTQKDINYNFSTFENDLKQFKLQNKKLLKQSNLELIQLMEQGDHVVKSPWSSWQFGINGFGNYWNTTYNGKGDKNKTGKITRDSDLLNRYLIEKDKIGITTSGTTSIKKVSEPIVEIEIKASITPRTVNTLNVEKNIKKEQITPIFSEIATFEEPVLDRPKANYNGVIGYNTSISYQTEDADKSYIAPTTTDLTGQQSSGVNFGVISQQNIGSTLTTGNGKIDITVSGNGRNQTTLKTTNVEFQGIKGTNHNIVSTYNNDLNITNINKPAVIRIGGGHIHNINDVDINISGINSHARLVNIFGLSNHSSNGDTTAVIGNNTTIISSGEKNSMFSQIHDSNNYNAGVINNGTLELSSGSSKNVVYLTGNNKTSTAYFDNENTIKIDGLNNTGIGVHSGNTSITNNGNFIVNGDRNIGVVISNIGSSNISPFELLLNKAIEVNGTNGVGVAIFGKIDLDGGLTTNQAAFDSTDSNINATALYKVGDSNKLSRESIINVNLSGTKNAAISFRGTDTGMNYDLNNFNLKSINGNENTLVLIANQPDGTLNLNKGEMEISGGVHNIAILDASKKDVVKNNGNIKISNSPRSIGIITSKTNGIVTNNGKLNLSGEGIRGIVGGNTSAIINNGDMNFHGTPYLDTTTGVIEGAMGIGSSNGATVTNNGNVNILVEGKNSVALHSYSANSNISNINMNNSIITAQNGAYNVFANANGIINFNNNNVLNTKQNSLTFYMNPTGKVNINGATTANIDDGNVFYYEGSGTPFSLATYNNDYFNNTLNNLTINMNGGNVITAKNITINVSDADISNIATTGGPTINGTDYKIFSIGLSKVTVDQDVNLDNTADAYNRIEAIHSTVTNNAIMTGTLDNQVAIAQQNTVDNTGVAYDASKIEIINNGEINLSGNNSTAIYSMRGNVTNTTTGKISIEKNSTAIYAVEDNESTTGSTAGVQITNDGEITLGENSIGLNYVALNNGGSIPTLTGGVRNNGKITGTSNNSTGIVFEKPANVINKEIINVGNITLNGNDTTGIYDKSEGIYQIVNSGIVEVGNSNSDTSVGIYTKNSNAEIVNNNSVKAGNGGVGIYGYEIKNSGIVEAEDNGAAIYSLGKDVDISNGTITVGKNKGNAVVLLGNGQTLNSNLATLMNIGDSSNGIINIGTGNTINSNISNVALESNSIYIYSNDNSGTINNFTNINSANTDGHNFGIYSSGNVTNNGNIDFSSGLGNVGIYSTNGGNAVNYGIIEVGKTDIPNEKYSIGMVAGYKNIDTGNIINKGMINVNNANSVGMYGTGNGTTVVNDNDINLGANNTIGMYLTEGAVGINNGNIQTSGNPKGAIGVVVRSGADFTNYGNINIDSEDGYAMFKLSSGTVRNYGNITLGNGAKEINNINTSKKMGAINITVPLFSETGIITYNGIKQTPLVVQIPQGQTEMLSSNLALYVDTLRGTNPVYGLKNKEVDLVFGTEAAATTNNKYIQVTGSILDPYNKVIANNTEVSKWLLGSASLTWLATATLDNTTGLIKNVYLAKIPYTEWAIDKNVYNFADGLEQRYDVNELDSREKILFNKLNTIGNTEDLLLAQAFDEMQGHQYGNIQQRINATGNMLNKEFDHLKNDWRNPTKQNNKVKIFGMRDEYKTNTAGIIDYTSDAYGIAYLHEDETVKLGNSTGWYAGVVNNRFEFKDIGKSQENQTMLKAGIFKSMSPNKDYNGSLKWNIAGEIFGGINEMKRKYWIVDDTFEANSNYYSYGVALKNEISKTFRTSERTTFKPYASLDLEYGRFTDIKEDNGEIRLEIKGNDYYSIKPELGIQFNYIQPFAERSQFSIGLTAAYENELGKINDVNNKAKVRFTNADWYNLRSEKENRRGNGKFDLNFGIDNTRIGFTANLGYDTNGKNLRGGIGLRAIY